MMSLIKSPAPTIAVAALAVSSLVTGCGGTTVNDPAEFNPEGTERASLDSGAEVVRYDFGNMVVHNYIDTPENGVGNSTYVIESAASLVLIDSQFFEASAQDFRAYVDGIGKPIDRMLITHGHQDHVRGIAAAFDDVTTYSSQGVIEEALADSGSVIDEVLGDSVEIDGVRYTFEVRNNVEAEEQVIMRLPDYGVVVLGDVLYNGWHAVMNPGFDNWIATLDEFAQQDDIHLFLAGHGEAGDSSDLEAAADYLTTARDAYAVSETGEEFQAAMVGAYPDYPGAFLLQLSVEQILYP